MTGTEGSPMKMAVTGASGMVGRAVVAQAVEDGHEVVAIDRVLPAPDLPGVARLQIDVEDYDAVERAFAGCDAVLHLAAINGPGRHPDHVVHANNVVGSYNVLRAAAAAGVPRVVQASSVNAIGGRFSRRARYDYFPVDEEHPAYPEDPYSLSKLICEQQASAIVRAFDGVSIASLRLHGVVDDRGVATRWVEILGGDLLVKQLWGYVRRDATARAFLAAATAGFTGHEAFYIIAPDTMVDTPSADLHRTHFPDVPLRSDLPGRASFFDSGKAARLLGWHHDPDGRRP